MKKTLLLVVSLLLLLAGCRSHDAQYDLAACGSYGVPGMFCLDLKENSCEVLAKDPYGRVLFRYTAYSVITKKIETAVVICQKSSSSNVCFY